MNEFINNFNTFAWVASNLLVLYIGVLLIGFVIGYYALFDPKSTTAGRFIFRFAFSLIGVVGLIFISVFVDPRVDQAWYLFPGDTLWWRPVVRLLVYGYVAYTITGLAILLGYRKFKPTALRTSVTETTLVKVRRPKGRGRRRNGKP